MMWYEDGMGWAGWLVGAVMMIVFWAIVVVGAVVLLRGWRGKGGMPFEHRSAEQILDERFAGGEIDVEEYIRHRELLRVGRETHPSTVKR